VAVVNGTSVTVGSLTLTYGTASNGYIPMTLSGPSDNWIGVGFGSPHSDMSTVVGWVTGTSTATVIPGISNSESTPTANTGLLQSNPAPSGTISGSTATLTFAVTESLFTSGAVTVDWAIGTKPTGTTYSQHTSMGSVANVQIGATTTTPTTGPTTTTTGPTTTTTTGPTTTTTTGPTTTTTTGPTTAPYQQPNAIGIYQVPGQVTVTWSYLVLNGVDNLLFTVTGQTGGWVGFGLSATGAHSAMDSYVSWYIPATKTGMVVDGYSNSQEMPSVDTQQDVQFVSALLDNNVTTVAFSRPFTTSDINDVQISLMTSFYICWALGPTTPISSTNYAQHTSQGTSSSQINLLTSMSVPHIGDASFVSPIRGLTVVCLFLLALLL